MNNTQVRKKSNNKKPIYILLVFLGVFSMFIYLLIKPSIETTAISEINSCTNAQDVKNVFYKYKNELIESEEFCQATRDKMKLFDLRQSEIIEIKKWLPSRTDNLNIIIVPDLSNRIIDSINNIDQIRRDSVIISAICENFESVVKSKMNSKDKLVIDITDRKQAGGKIGELADTILFDLSSFKNKSNRLYFDGKRDQFKNGVKKLYEVAYDFEVKNPKGGGADYVSYFSSKLKSKIQKSTFDDNYKNILIILTDGYLEATKPGGEIVSYYKKDPTTIIETASSRFNELDVYLLDVNRKKNASDLDEINLRRWWLKWFKLMNVKNVEEESEDDVIIKRLDGFTDINKRIEEIVRGQK